MPIFIAWTRSFWLGIVPALLVLLDVAVQLGTSSVAGPVAGLIAAATGWSTSGIEDVLRGVAALAALLIAHQRRGHNRPYTTDPRAVQ